MNKSKKTRRSTSSFQRNTQLNNQHTTPLFQDHTTIHGLNDLLASQSMAARLCWLTVLALTGSCLLYNIVKTTIDFYNSPLVTTLSTFFEERYPDIMYCPHGVAASEEVLRLYNLTEDDLMFVNHYFGQYTKYHRGFEWVCSLLCFGVWSNEYETPLRRTL